MGKMNGLLAAQSEVISIIELPVNKIYKPNTNIKQYVRQIRKYFHTFYKKNIVPNTQCRRVFFLCNLQFIVFRFQSPLFGILNAHFEWITDERN